MDHNKINRPLEKVLRIYAVLATVIVMTQLVGLVMYLVNVWPGVRAAGLDGEPVPDGIITLLAVAVLVGFARSFVWIRIYWNGSNVFKLLGTKKDSAEATSLLVSLLGRLTRLFVVACLLDVLFLPAYFLSDIVVAFPLAGWRLGVIEVARVIFPQAFGIAALILAFLTHQYGELLGERRQMRHELELTI